MLSTYTHFCNLLVTAYTHRLVEPLSPSTVNIAMFQSHPSLASPSDPLPHNPHLFQHSKWLEAKVSVSGHDAGPDPVQAMSLINRLQLFPAVFTPTPDVASRLPSDWGQQCLHTLEAAAAMLEATHFQANPLQISMMLMLCMHSMLRHVLQKCAYSWFEYVQQRCTMCLSSLITTNETEPETELCSPRLDRHVPTLCILPAPYLQSCSALNGLQQCEHMHAVAWLSEQFCASRYWCHAD